MAAKSSKKKTTTKSKSKGTSKNTIAQAKGLSTGVSSTVTNSSGVSRTANTTTSVKDDSTLSKYESKDAQYNKALSKSIKGSVRLFGVPHQLLPHNDPRIGSVTGVNGLGKLYAEKIILEAPIVYIKPGKSKFMPGSNSSDRDGMKKALLSAVSGDYSDLEAIVNDETDKEDIIRYFGFEQDYSGYMTQVNLLCRFMAQFLGIADKRVPWASHVDFGHYDWRYYKFNKTMDSKATDMGSKGKGIGAFISDVFESVGKKISEDDMYVSFYVDSGMSFSESASNSTTSSVIKQYTDQISSLAKELQTVSNISGFDAQGLANSVTSSLDSYVSGIQGDGALANFMKRLTSTTNQIVQGANFLVPDIWSDSEYSKNYQVSVSLATPYGNKVSWYLNIGVPLCFLLGLALPHGSTANTYTSPHLVQCFAPGWFNCSMGIVDNISIDKGGDGCWNMAGLPNEMKVTLSIRDLYQSLTLPKSNNALGFMQNTGMVEFLLVNSGVDMTVSSLSDVWEVWKLMFTNGFTSKIQAAPYDKLISLRNKVNSFGKLLK